MSIEACGIRISVNGSETDVDVENDSAAWTSKIGNVRITGGGGSWWRQPKPFTLNIDVDVPLEVAHLIRTVAVAVTLEQTTVSTLPYYAVAASGGNGPYRIVFSGSVVSVRGSNSSPYLQVDCVDEHQTLLSRRARTAAANNSGIRALLAAIETAHSITVNGTSYFPDAADFPNLDRPAQKGASNGEWIRKALQGTGINISAAWEGTITSPVMLWWPDYFDSVYSASVNTGAQQTLTVGYPWALDYPDAGIAWNDFVARVNIDGEDSAGNEYYGWARLSSSAERVKLGNKEINATTWIDNTTDLQRQARRQMARTGEPGYLKLNQITIPVEHYWTQLDTYGGADPEIEVFMAASLHPGDLLAVRDPWDNTNTDYGNFPAIAAIGSQIEDNLQSLWQPFVADGAAGAVAVEFVVRTVTREWNPSGGWFCTYGVDPHAANGALVGNDISDYGNGTY